MKDSRSKAAAKTAGLSGYNSVLAGVSELLEAARRTSVRATNAIMTATYWEIGRRIVEHEQRGLSRAGYGETLLKRLSVDLTGRFGRGFSERNLEQMRLFYNAWSISQTLSAKLDDFEQGEKIQTPSGELSVGKMQTASTHLNLRDIANRFPLPWSHYVRLLSVQNHEGRVFYEKEALRGGWSVRQLDRQINSQFYERTALSRNKAAMLKKGSIPLPDDIVTAEEEIKDPFVLEFLGLKDEYSEGDLEEPDKSIRLAFFGIDMRDFPANKRVKLLQCLWPNVLTTNIGAGKDGAY